MELTGIRTDISRVTIKVDPIEALRKIDSINRKSLNIDEYCFLALNKDGEKVLMVEQEHYHGSPWNEIIDDNPSEEAIQYLEAYRKFFDLTWDLKRNATL